VPRHEAARSGLNSSPVRRGFGAPGCLRYRMSVARAVSVNHHGLRTAKGRPRQRTLVGPTFKAHGPTASVRGLLAGTRALRKRGRQSGRKFKDHPVFRRHRAAHGSGLTFSGTFCGEAPFGACRRIQVAGGRNRQATSSVSESAS